MTLPWDSAKQAEECRSKWLSPSRSWKSAGSEIGEMSSCRLERDCWGLGSTSSGEIGLFLPICEVLQVQATECRYTNMSFEDLWDQVDLVTHHSELRREGVEDLLDLLKSRSALELKYHQGLDKLSHSPKCVSRSGTLAEAVSALKAHWQHRAAQGRAMAALLSAEVVKPLELLLTQQSPLARAQSKESKMLEKSLLQKTEKYEKTRQRYEKQNREAENLAQAVSSPEPDRGQIRSKLAVAKLEVDVALEQCVSALEDLNSSRLHNLSTLVQCT